MNKTPLTRGQVSMTTVLLAAAVVTAAVGAGLYVYGSQSSVFGPAKAAGLCVDHCGDGTCDEAVCAGSGCPCAESADTCPNDCGGQANVSVFSLCDGRWDSGDLDDMQEILDSIQATGSPPNGSDYKCADINNDTYLTSDDAACLAGVLSRAYKSPKKCPDCAPSSVLEICHDGIDNDCDGQTDTDLRKGADACDCSAVTMCDTRYDADGIAGFGNSTDKMLCRDFGDGFGWYTAKKWQNRCNKAADAGNSAYCGNREFICTDGIEWKKCGPGLSCDTTIEIGGETYWCRNIDNAWSWHKCPQCGDAPSCGEGAFEQYPVGTEMRCEDKLFSCAAGGWERYTCNGNQGCNDTLSFGGREYWCRNINGEGWGWTDCPSCKGTGCEGVPASQRESYSRGDIMECGGEAYYCTIDGWAEGLTGTFSYFTDPGPAINGVWLGTSVADKTLWGPFGSSEESDEPPRWHIAQWQGYLGKSNTPLREPYLLTTGGFKSGKGPCTGQAEWHISSDSARVCWIPMNDGTYQVEIHQDSSGFDCGFEYNILLSPTQQNYPDYPVGFLGKDLSPPLSELESVRYKFGASLPSSQTRNTQCSLDKRDTMASIVLNNYVESQTLFYQISLEHGSGGMSWFFRGQPFGVDVSLAYFDQPKLSSTRQEYDFDVLQGLKDAIADGDGMDKDLSHWRVTSTYIGGHVWGGGSHTLLLDHVELVGTVK